MFRLHIDIQISDDEETAIRYAKRILNEIARLHNPLNIGVTNGLDISSAQVKLCRDGDRGGQNYLNKNEEGRALTAKNKLF